MRTLREILEGLGAAGVLGIGVLLFCALFYFSGVRPLERELTAQQIAAERLKARGPVQLIAARDRAEELRRFYGLFPPVEQLPNELARVYGLARAAKLQVQQAEYRLESRDSGLIAYHITFPIGGTYGQIRQFVSAALKDMSFASLDSLRFERKKVGDTHLEAQVQLTIHFRPESEANLRPLAQSGEAR
ncbi:MAG: hypothetical protein JWO70_4377 [Betaproteobacteria bacterium]|nr:hypothetical protein [Betaproteobacteria bacterium]